MLNFGPVLTAAAVAALLAWLFLYGFRGGFWKADQRLGLAAGDRRPWPAVAAIVPARNEAATIRRTTASLLGQDYPGPLRVLIVDDGSGDGTAAEAGAADDGSGRLVVETGKVLPSGWTGKLWALSQGIAAGDRLWPETRYLLLTDADVEHAGDNVRRLVEKAESEGCDLVSLMVLLHCQSIWERLLIPAFVFYFQKLYPFSRINDRRRPEAGAAGGVMLVRRSALAEAGGVDAIRGQLIDDCALARRIKARGRIWLGLTTRTRSLRRYDRLRDLWAMVVRTAFTQLDYSPVALAATVVAMTVLYLVPPVAAVLGVFIDAPAAAAGAIACLVMFRMLLPTLRLYRLAPAWALALPVAGLLFTLMTVDSARRHWQGRGSTWKLRDYAGPAGSRLRRR
jgi:hopene-associated glycosyltransferase HpnB